MKDQLPIDESIALLRALATPQGILASRSAVANYAAVFARDAIMAGLAGLAAGDEQIVTGLRRTLEQLRALQGPQGQIASNFRTGPDGRQQVSFGTLAPRFDSATWYLVGVALLCARGHARYEDFAESAEGVVDLLEGIEYNGRHLLYVPAGGNWADEYPFDGYILYDQVLRAWGLRLLAPLAGKPAWAEKSAAIARVIDERYWPSTDWQYGGPRRFPVAATSPVRTDEHLDLAACALLAIADLLPHRSASILDGLEQGFLAHGALVPAFSPVIHEGDREWDALAGYHLHGFRNRPHEYHNGGIWPVWLGWLGVALARHGRVATSGTLHALTVAHLHRLTHFDFEEYFHGQTGEALGTAGMAYTATGFVLLDLARQRGPEAWTWIA
ncbi:glycoside hydrolase 100 family protein [Gemmatimonas sp.]|jgi:hypothetical protein|uniref:glycoside hydrolase 100 family protein n=1 Tax=Gemmatimonas sp. TaxID=1962908 RepID=UPI0037BF1A08